MSCSRPAHGSTGSKRRVCALPLKMPVPRVELKQDLLNQQKLTTTPCSQGCARHLLSKRPAASAAKRPVYEVAAKANKANGEVAKISGLSKANHGGSEMRIYATTGAINLGKGESNLDMARSLPSQFYTMDMLQMQKVGVVISVKQFMMKEGLTRLLSHGSVDKVIVGGWSLGSSFAFHAVMDLEACLASPRAAFTLDARTLSPVPPTTLNLDPTKVGGGGETREWLARFNLRALVNAQLLEVARFRFSIPSFHFGCPLQAHEAALMSDHSVAVRRLLYTKVGVFHHHPDSTHGTIGSDHYWDIGRRLRGLESFEAANAIAA